MASLNQHTRLAEDLVTAYNSSDTDAISRLNLGFFGCPGDICDDDAMPAFPATIRVNYSAH